MEKTFYNIFKTFFKVGTMLLGGGYVILPLLTSELVEKKKWITSDELCEYYALSSSLPGIIAANTAIFTGRKLGGTKGALAAIVGVTMPAFIAIILIASVFSEIAHYRSVEYVFWGVGIGVITLLFLAVREMWGKCLVDRYSSVLFGLCLGMALFTKLSPAVIVIFAIVVGCVRQFVLSHKKGRNVDG